ncbi:hypothetical protein MHYP_G00095630 [Metynnis hypsauchen]
MLSDQLFDVIQRHTDEDRSETIRSIATPLRMRVQLLVAPAMTRAEGGLALPRRSESAGQYCSPVRPRFPPSHPSEEQSGAELLRLCAEPPPQSASAFQKPETNVRSRLRSSLCPA